MTYNSTLPKVFVYLLTTIETLYQTSVPLEVQNRKNVHLATSDCLVIACYLWGLVKRLKLSTNWLKVYFLIGLAQSFFVKSKIVFALLCASFFVKVVLFHANEIVFPKLYSAQVDIKLY